VSTATDPVLSRSTAAVASVDESTAATPSAEEPGVPRPKWLERAEKTLAEAELALAAGNERVARKRLSKVLKLLAGGADDSTLVDMKDDIADLLSQAEEELSPPVPEAASPPDTLDVTDEQLKAAPPAAPGPPSDAKKFSYSMPIDANDPLVKKYISLYTNETRYRNNLQAAFNRMAVHRAMVLKEIDSLGLPRELQYLPLVESEYQIRAVSRAGAVGLWQFMTVTGRNMGLKINYWIDERLDPVKSTKSALHHLKDLHDWFQSWPLALAAYNRGIYGIQRDLESTRSPDFSSLSNRGALPNETEHYVPKFMALTLIGDNAETYGFTAPKAPKNPPVDEIVLPKPLDLKIAAKCAKTTEDAIRDLNPTLRLWCTPKDETSFPLRIPRGTKEQTLACLAETKDWTPASELVKYRVKRGDFLGRIASRYKTTVAAVMKENRLSSPKRIRVGQILRIRPGRGFKGKKEKGSK
jgi:membrane-bound lytic murein transglycosylase D